MTVRVLDERLLDVVAPDARLERLAGGFHFTEGPVWTQADGGYLLFSDIVGDVVRRYDDAGGVREWRRPSEMANGLTRDERGRLLVCEARTSRRSRTEPDGSTTVVASHFEGRELNSPNDVVVRSDGSIWFTDPPSGRGARTGFPRPRELDFQGVFRILPAAARPGWRSGTSTRRTASASRRTSRPSSSTTRSGCTSAASRCAPTGARRRRGLLRAARRAARRRGADPGADRDGHVSVGLPDGLKADERGNLYCTGPGGIWVIAADATHLGVLEVPENVGNLAFGGPDWSTLYVCATTSLYRLPLGVRGAPVPHMVLTGRRRRSSSR